MTDDRYKNMKCEKCGSTHFVFTVLQHEEYIDGKTYHMSQINATCECGETKKVISDLVTYIK